MHQHWSFLQRLLSTAATVVILGVLLSGSAFAALTGRRPGSTGIYHNSARWHEALPNLTSIPQHFKANGYHVVGDEPDYGLDSVLIDTEHIALDRAQLSAWIARVPPKAFLAASCVRAFLRISENPALDSARIGSGRVRSEYGNRIRSARRSP